MSTRSATFDHLKANVEGTVEFVDALETLLTASDRNEIDPDTWPAVDETLRDHGITDDDLDGLELVEVVDLLLDSAVLETYGNARVTVDTVDVREIVVVTGVGGPHIEFGIDYNGRVVARGYWSSDKIERVTYAPALGEYLIELLGGWDR